VARAPPCTQRGSSVTPSILHYWQHVALSWPEGRKGDDGDAKKFIEFGTGCASNQALRTLQKNTKLKVKDKYRDWALGRLAREGGPGITYEVWTRLGRDRIPPPPLLLYFNIMGILGLKAMRTDKLEKSCGTRPHTS